MKSQNFNLIIIIGLSLLLYILSLIVTQKDVNFSSSWIAFLLWTGSVLAPLFFLALSKINRFIVILRNLSFKKFLPFLIILVLAIGIKSFLLDIYPFVAVGDEVRDSGLDAWRILTKDIPNIFSYGRYDSHSLIIPTISSLFYLFFENSVYTYRIPALLVSVGTLVATYLLAKKEAGLRTAVLSSLFLINLPLEMYFARTEFLVVLTGFFTIILIVALLKTLEENSIQNYMVMGLLLGFASSLHASVRTAVFLTIIIIICAALHKLMAQREILRITGKLFIISLFFFIGFGPRVLFTPPDVFFRPSKLALFSNTSQNIPASFQQVVKFASLIPERYLTSLKGYAWSSVSVHYPVPHPLISPIFGIFFIIGIVWLTKKPPSLYGKIIVLYLLVIPLTNSAITNCVNCDYRISSIIPLTALATGAGLAASLRLIEKIRFKQVTVLWAAWLFIICLILYEGFKFFYDQPASFGKPKQYYLSMHMIYLLQKLNLPKTIFISLSNSTYEHFNLVHMQEQRQYFLPNTAVSMQKNQALSDNEVYISLKEKDQEAIYSTNVYCNKQELFICPPKDPGALLIHVDKNLLQ